MFSRPSLTPQSGIGSNRPWWWREGQFPKFCTDMDDCLQILYCTKTLIFRNDTYNLEITVFYLVLYHNNNKNNNNNNNINIILKYANKSTWKSDNSGFTFSCKNVLEAGSKYSSSFISTILPRTNRSDEF